MMSRIINSLLSLGLMSMVLFSCQKELDAPVVDAKSEDFQTYSFSGEIDPVYEFDDEEFRAANFTAENAPRIVLSDADFDGPVVNANSVSGANTYDKTTVRINWLYFDKSQKRKGTIPAEGANVHNGQMIAGQRQDVILSRKADHYRLDMKIRLKNNGNITPNSNYVWFGNVYLGGFPGAPGNGSLSQTDERAMQYYSRVFSAKVNGKEYTLASPNFRIDELDETNGTMARRHFPLVGDIAKLKLWSDPQDPTGPYDNDGNVTGHLMTEEKFYLKPRGTIFTMTLDNQTGRNIEVTHIEVPFKGTRGQAFSFEGSFKASGLNPYGANGEVDPNRCSPTYARFDGNGNPPYARPEIAAMYNTDTFQFPVYRKGGAPGFELVENEATNSRFMVWAYAHKPELMRPFTVRVRYKIDGQGSAVESKFQTVAPPEGGFKEGKAYRFRFVIKPKNIGDAPVDAGIGAGGVGTGGHADNSPGAIPS